MITIGSFLTGSADWKMLMIAILGQQAVDEGVNKASPMIDSRLNTVHCKTEDVSDEFDEILRQRRIKLTVLDLNSFATLLYRIEELAIHEDERIRDEAFYLFHWLCHEYLGIDESRDDLWLGEFPLMNKCPKCQKNNMEIQDQCWVCYECAWVGDYHSEWPYLHSGTEYLGRIDQFVKINFGKQSPNDDKEYADVGEDADNG